MVLTNNHQLKLTMKINSHHHKLDQHKITPNHCKVPDPVLAKNQLLHLKLT